MPAPDTTLQAIQTKVRRLTQSPSTAQLTDTDLQNYINTFLVYDFPEILRTFNYRTTFTFYTNPYQDEYSTDEASFGDPVANPTITANPLYDFQNKYLTVHPPVYVAGYQALYSQSPEQFYGIYPKINFIQFTGSSGDGATMLFTGTINSQQSTVPTGFNQNIALLQRQILFNSADALGNGLSLVDVPVIDASTGNSTVNGNLYDPASAAYQAALATPPTTVDATNTINYATGVYTITFGTPPGTDEPINSQTVPLVAALPQAVMYYANKFVIRPIPDQVYRVNIEVYKSPVSLLDSAQSPELKEYFQFIAYGAAIKILQDRLEMDTVNLHMPEFRRQEILVNRRTIVQNTTQRTPSIYVEQTGPTAGGFGWGGGNNI